MKKTNEKIISETIKFVKETLSNSEGGHDWWHIYRVWRLATEIAKEEKADMLVVELSALLHDIADAKFYKNDEEIGSKKAREFLERFDLDEKTVDHAVNITKNVSFRKEFDDQEFKSKELDIVKDADRLDAIGAMGIIRAFNYGGYKNKKIYDPEVKPNLNINKEEYISEKSPTINHFYEKLLLLKDKMRTEMGKEIAQNRHIFMEKFLEEFYGEWEGEK
jgi:uncharacterized protein